VGQVLTERSRVQRLALRTLGVLILLIGSLGTVAQASETATLSASFTPDKLGANTAFTFGFEIGSSNEQIPSPLTGVALHLPAGLGFFTSTLGQEVCRPAALLARGVGGCSPNAIMGSGSALAKVLIGPEILEVPIKITVIMGPASNHHTGMLYYAEGDSAVVADLVFPGVVLGESYPFSTLLNTSIPITHSLPDAPDVAVTQMQTTVGPSGLLYSKRAHGKLVTYHPEGMAVPERCPPAGFPFAATFSFEDNTSVTATSTIACPLQPRDAKRKGKRG
jgi:hypothetical protein